MRRSTAVGIEKKSAAVSVSALSHRYGEALVLDDVDLHVEPGQLVTLLGPSGSGKTTLLRLIAGLIEVEQGQIFIGEDDVTRQDANQRDIGLVFQNYALFPHLNVRENVEFPLKMRRIQSAERRRRALEAIDMVGLKDMHGKHPGELSGGQQQRVALARAIVSRPQVLLLDEPMGALDRRLRESLAAELRSLQQELSMTAIYVTHDQDEAFVLSDLVAVMNGGRIAQLGTPEEIYRTPRDEFVARFVGDLSAVRGTVSDASGDHLIVECGNIEIRASRRNGFSSGQQVCVGLRPEALHLGAASAGRASLSGTVSRSTFVGRANRVVVDCSGRDFVLDTERTSEARAGQQVSLSYSPDDVILCAAS